MFKYQKCFNFEVIIICYLIKVKYSSVVQNSNILIVVPHFLSPLNKKGGVLYDSKGRIFEQVKEIF